MAFQLSTKSRCIVLFLAMIILCVKARNGGHRWAGRPEHVLARSLRDDLSHRESLVDADQYTFSDFHKGLTCVKDATLRACFITQLDPGFSMTLDEKLEVMNSEEPMVVKNKLDLFGLLDKAGPDIATSCKTESIYWLDSEPMVLPPGMPRGPPPRPSGNKPFPPSPQTLPDQSEPTRPHAKAPPHLSAPEPLHSPIRAPPRLHAPPPVNQYRYKLSDHP